MVAFTVGEIVATVLASVFGLTLLSLGILLLLVVQKNRRSHGDGSPTIDRDPEKARGMPPAAGPMLLPPRRPMMRPQSINQQVQNRAGIESPDQKAPTITRVDMMFPSAVLHSRGRRKSSHSSSRGSISSCNSVGKGSASGSNPSTPSQCGTHRERRSRAGKSQQSGKSLKHNGQRQIGHNRGMVGEINKPLRSPRAAIPMIRGGRAISTGLPRNRAPLTPRESRLSNVVHQNRLEPARWNGQMMGVDTTQGRTPTRRPGNDRQHRINNQAFRYARGGRGVAGYERANPWK